MRIRLVRHHRIRTGSRPSTPKAGDLDPVEQRNQLRVVTGLAGGKDHTHRHTASVDREMNLAAQSSSGTSEAFSVDGERFDCRCAAP